ENADGFGGPEQPPELVDEVAAPVVESPAAKFGLVAPSRVVLAGGGSDATGELAEPALDVDQLPEHARLHRRPDGQIIDVPAAVVKNAQHLAPHPGLAQHLARLLQVQRHRLL